MWMFVAEFWVAYDRDQEQITENTYLEVELLGALHRLGGSA